MTSYLCISASCQSNQAPSWAIIWCHRGGFKSNRISCPPETVVLQCVFDQEEWRGRGKASAGQSGDFSWLKTNSLFPLRQKHSFTSKIVFYWFFFPLLFVMSTLFCPVDILCYVDKKCKNSKGQSVRGAVMSLYHFACLFVCFLISKNSLTVFHPRCPLTKTLKKQKTHSHSSQVDPRVLGLGKSGKLHSQALGKCNLLIPYCMIKARLTDSNWKITAQLKARSVTKHQLGM